MVFKDMFKAWKQKSLLSKSLDELKIMLAEDRIMFKVANEALFQGKKPEMDFYKQDRKINEHEMDIRRMILEHFSINPTQDVNVFLILLIANKDFERIGDYCKNIFELSHLYKKPLQGAKYVFSLIKIQERIEHMFDLTEKAFFGTKKEKGKEVMNIQKELSRELDKLIQEIIDDKKIDTRKAIVCVLLARYFKRISAHLKNISRAVVNPFDKIKNNVAMKGLPKNVPAWKAKK